MNRELDDDEFVGIAPVEVPEVVIDPQLTLSPGAAAITVATNATTLQQLTKAWDVNFILILVLVFVLYRIHSRFSIAHSLLAGLEYWRPPSNEEIAALPLKPSPDEHQKLNRKKAGRRGVGSGEVQLTLSSALLDDVCFIGRPEFDRFDSVILLSTLAAGAYLVTEIWSCVSGANHSEHHMYAIALAVLLIWYHLAACLFGAVWWNGHVKLALFTAAIFFVLSFATLSLLPNQLLDIDIDASFARCVIQLNEFFAAHKLANVRVPDGLTALPYRIWCSTAIGIMAGLYLLPAFRYAASYYHITEQYDDAKSSHAAAAARAAAVESSSVTNMLRSVCPRADWWWRVGSIINFFNPLLLAVLWIRPLTRDALVGGGGALTDAHYDTIRIAYTLAAGALQFVIYWIHLQSYLTSNVLILRNFWSEMNANAGKGIQLCLRKIFLDTPTAALQYLGPALTTLLFTLALKRKQSVCIGVCALFFGSAGSVAPDAAALAAATAATATAAAPTAGAAVAFQLMNNALVVPTLSILLFGHVTVWFVQSCFCLLYVRQTYGTDSYAKTMLTL